MYRVTQLPPDLDTRELRRALWAHRIGHRITEAAEGQTLWLADLRQQQKLLRLLARWQRGEPLMPDERPSRRADGPSCGLLVRALRQGLGNAATLRVGPV